MGVTFTDARVAGLRSAEAALRPATWSGRSEATFEEYVRLDLYYVDNWSLWSDLAILAKTVPTVLARRGAY